MNVPINEKSAAFRDVVLCLFPAFESLEAKPFNEDATVSEALIKNKKTPDVQEDEGVGSNRAHGEASCIAAVNMYRETCCAHGRLRLAQKFGSYHSEHRSKHVALYLFPLKLAYYIWYAGFQVRNCRGSRLSLFYL